MNRTHEKLEALLGRGSVERIDVPGSRGLPLAVPANETEIVETIRLAASEHWSIVPVGSGSKLSWRRPARADFALSTRRIAGVVAYEPGDGTITARAGTTISELERVTREGGNHFTPRVPVPEHGTLGGVLAAGQSGIDRLRCGPARHHVLGMRVALADGSVAKSGGRLVKNVTGYDMHRLYCGSHGTLCVILEASMRLFAGFERELLLTASVASRAGAIEAARNAAELQPLCVRAENVLDPGGDWRVHVLLAGRSAVVESAQRDALELLPDAVTGVETSSRLRDAELADGAWASLRVSGRPSILRDALGTLPPDLRMIVEPSIASMDAFVAPSELERTSSLLRNSGLEVRVRGPLADAPEAADQRGELMKRLRASIDPLRTFSG